MCVPPSRNMCTENLVASFLKIYWSFRKNFLYEIKLQHQSIARGCESWKHTLRWRDNKRQLMPGLKRVTLNKNKAVGDKGLIKILEVLVDDFWLKGELLSIIINFLFFILLVAITEFSDYFIFNSLKPNLIDFLFNSKISEENLVHLINRFHNHV